jgi:SAM-dependent methyltransferase
VTRRKYRVEYHIPAFAEFDRWAGKRVLEIGGGICTTATSFAKAGAHVTVAELSPKSMEMCKARFETMGLADRATFYVVNAEKLSDVVPVSQFDLVWSFGVIHHSPNPDRIISEVLRPCSAKAVHDKKRGPGRPTAAAEAPAALRHACGDAQVRKYMGPHTVLKLMVYSKISFKLFWVMNHTNQARAPPLPPAGPWRLAPRASSPGAPRGSAGPCGVSPA